MRRHTPRISNLAAGIIAVVVLAAVSYLVFGGGLPFGSPPFVLKAVFTTPTQLHIPSPVRIAGVDVGQVVSVKPFPNSQGAAVITMNINNNGLPIHSNATANIRSRIFLEGNFYVDLHPGTPSAPSLSSGATLPAANTAGTVQLDRVLSSLNANSRANLQTLLQGLGGGFNSPTTPGEDATQDPSVRGLTGGQSLNKALQYSFDAFRASTIVNEGLLGTQSHDLSNVVVGEERVFKALATSPDQLSSLVHTFNATMAALAARQQQLSQTIALLPPFLRATDAALGPLNASFGPTKEFARALTPSITQLGATITAALPWLHQSTLLLSPQELGGLLNDLTPAIQNTSSSLTATKGLLRAAGALARCFSHNVVPAGNEVIKDPPGDSTGLPVYQELFQGTVGLAGAAGNFDGNGRYLRSSAGGGTIIKQTPNLPVGGPEYGNFILPPLGTRPAWPGKPPPIKRGVACNANPVPSLNKVSTGAAP
jgi:phospholipid/cholesterol/gamma-HCH transport system substrate-binding protein